MQFKSVNYPSASKYLILRTKYGLKNFEIAHHIEIHPNYLGKILNGTFPLSRKLESRLESLLTAVEAEIAAKAQEGGGTC